MENNFWKILESYRHGWSDSGECKIAPYKATKKYEDIVLQYAYEVGWDDYIIGDMVTSVDLQTNKEIVDKIRKNFKK